ncbi:MAG: hypothetical protein H0Z34_13750 [Brevibacillus sp.]|nr:hypothetical protein [Brevibacillus sp.]
MTAVGMSPDEPRIWLGTNSGLYLSASPGLWTLLAPELAEVAVTGWVIDPNQTDLIVIGAQNGSMRSTDGGRTWQESDAGLPRQPLYHLTGARVNDQLYLYAYVAEEGIFQSVDGGVSWQKWTDSDEISAMQYLPNEKQLYVVTRDLLLHTDGREWSRDTIPGVKQIYSVAIDRSEERLYAATDQGVYCRERHGWKPLEAQTPEKLVMLGPGWGEYKLVAVGESAYLYTLLDGSWQKWDES